MATRIKARTRFMTLNTFSYTFPITTRRNCLSREFVGFVGKMNKFLLYGLQIYCVFVYTVLFCNAEGLTQPKRFTNQQRLFPFPRVGRGHENRFDFGLGRPNEDRISLFAFPRIGRSDESFPKRNAKNMNTGLWFGPRLGRVHKRDVYVYDLPHNYPREIIFAGGKYDMEDLPETRQVHYTPRLGRESEEDVEQSTEEA